MKLRKVSIALLVLALAGIAVFSQLLTRQEDKEKTRELLSTGGRLVSLIALHAIHDFSGQNSGLFMKTLMEASPQGLAYCFINDQSGRPVVSLSPDIMESEIPKEIRSESLGAMGIVQQSFQNSRSGKRVYEFAKPIFENGKKTGTVRLGLDLPSVPLLSMERISLVAVLLFFIISAVTIVYYGFIKALMPLEEFSQHMLTHGKGSATGLSNSSKGAGFFPMMEEFRNSLVQFKNRLEHIEGRNRELSSRIGVLRFEKNQVMHILNSIHFGIIITDTQDNVTHVNNYMLNLLRKDRSNVVGRPVDEILQHPEIRSFILQQEGLKHRGTNGHMDICFPKRAPGKTFRISSSNVVDNENAGIGKMIMFANITREKAAEKATLEFTAHLSHELITPLTTIKSYSEMLMDHEVQDKETENEFYNTINNETTRLSRLIKDLLRLSKIEMGSLTLNKGLVKSDWLFGDCIGAVEGVAQQKNISLKKQLPDNFPSLIGDKDQLKSALINILSNAVKYTPEKGEILFGLREEDSMVIFDIKDTGYGMSEEDLSHIFDTFYRSSNPQIVEQQGTGLGLAITSKIIALHEGNIEVQSKLGYGSHFVIRIPKQEYYLGEEQEDPHH